jgi:hypothetical protein
MRRPVVFGEVAEEGDAAEGHTTTGTFGPVLIANTDLSFADIDNRDKALSS